MWLLILTFITFSLLVFIINNAWLLLAFTILNVLLMIIFKIKIKKIFSNLVKNLVFILIVFLFNLIFDNLINSMIVAWKILIVLNGSFIFSAKISPTKLANGFCQLFYPLKIFKVNVDDLSLMMVIAFNFIPIIVSDTANLKQALLARNIKLNLKTLFTKTHIIFVMFFANIFRKVNELEQALLARNYLKKEKF